MGGQGGGPKNILLLSFLRKKINIFLFFWRVYLQLVAKIFFLFFYSRKEESQKKGVGSPKKILLLLWRVNLQLVAKIFFFFYSRKDIFFKILLLFLQRRRRFFDFFLLFKRSMIPFNLGSLQFFVWEQKNNINLFFSSSFGEFLFFLSKKEENLKQ